jgi:ABC-2 type transport system ATP-binding protein
MNGLDPLGIRKMRELIILLNRERNITFLISSHILTELDKVATRYGFISKGKLIKEITQKELHELDIGIEDYYLEIVEGIKYV